MARDIEDIKKLDVHQLQNEFAQLDDLTENVVPKLTNELEAARAAVAELTESVAELTKGRDEATKARDEALRTAAAVEAANMKRDDVIVEAQAILAKVGAVSTACQELSAGISAWVGKSGSLETLPSVTHARKEAARKRIAEMQAEMDKLAGQV